MNSQPEFSEAIRARLAKEPHLAPRAFTDESGNRVYRVTGPTGRRWIGEKEMETLLDQILPE